MIHAKPDFYGPRPVLAAVQEMRQVGLGELLARLEQLKQKLGAQGLFAPDRKKPLPFLPQLIGLITGRASAAERDVLENARRRWPGVRFEVRNVAVQGATAVPQVVGALGAGRAPRGGRDRHRARRRLGRGPAAVLGRATAAGGRRRAARRWSRRSGTSRTRRCWTWSPTCGPPRRRTRRSGSCRTSRGAGAGPDGPGSGCAGPSSGCWAPRSGRWRTAGPPVLAAPYDMIDRRERN